MDKVENLVAAAYKARERAYAPYSGYQVGAALLTASGRVYSGCNIENAAYGATVCAERVALFKAVSEGERKFTALAVATEGKEAASPCGTCRQVLWELAPELVLYLTGPDGVQRVTLEELLPRAFGPTHLREDCVHE
ncbi:MAG: cytidine deaminase [Firmicutes bacterium]|jgi:cytidine deaminase|nr:cytidine deaminase [Bacillota bacterium]